MISLARKIKRRIQVQLSHHPKTYAITAGIGIVLFWRGVWHTADYIHVQYGGFSKSIDAFSTLWWDGPISFMVGIIILYFTGALVSSFIGGELILSGLRGERRITEKAETDLKEEVSAIADIKDELEVVSKKLELLQKHADQNHKHL